jgi:hypothetical protein
VKEKHTASLNVLNFKVSKSITISNNFKLEKIIDIMKFLINLKQNDWPLLSFSLTSNTVTILGTQKNLIYIFTSKSYQPCDGKFISNLCNDNFFVLQLGIGGSLPQTIIP